MRTCKTAYSQRYSSSRTTLTKFCWP